MTKKLFVTISLLSTCFCVVKAQTLPVGSVAVEDYYRRSQLLGKADSSVSFMVRPVFPKSIGDGLYADPNGQIDSKFSNQLYGTQDSKASIVLLSVSMQNQINSHHAYGWNDGAMIPAKGLQTLISGGIYAKYGALSVQLKPEFVTAANSYFETFNKDHYDVIFARYYDVYNNIDLPVKFGTQSYTRVYWGQSSIRLNYKSLSFGVSTENLWWGPGIRNSLLMSNSAPGFPHLTFNTTQPIKTGIGSFEGQLIAGRLIGSGFAPLYPDNKAYFGVNLYNPKPNLWRYLSGIVLTWQPKWVPGLFLGYSQSAQLYGKDLSGIKDYLPFFSAIKSVSAQDVSANKRDTRNSMFARWLWPEEHAEVYFEFGRNNYMGDLRQVLLQPDASRAYIFGLRKLIVTDKANNGGILISAEATQMQETSVDNILNGLGWYINNNIRQGYTYKGESLGAGIGPGANLQSLDASWVRGLKRLGLQLERYAHNNDFYYYAYIDTQDWRRHWVDLSLALSGEWDYKNFIFNGKLQGIQSLNYQWYLDPTLNRNPGDPYYVSGINKFNLQIQAGLTYRF
jgi:hypothetical protein